MLQWHVMEERKDKYSGLTVNKDTKVTCQSVVCSFGVSLLSGVSEKTSQTHVLSIEILK